VICTPDDWICEHEPIPTRHTRPSSEVGRILGDGLRYQKKKRADCHGSPHGNEEE